MLPTLMVSMLQDLTFGRELSNGHFSNDNQKRLNGHQTDIPIYEAKMTRDSRLVVSELCQYCALFYDILLL